jgi:hypothetical protein
VVTALGFELPETFCPLRCGSAMISNRIKIVQKVLYFIENSKYLMKYMAVVK